MPNRTRQSVLLGDVIKDADEGPLQIVIGKDVEGRSIVSDLAKMPTCSSAALPVRQVGVNQRHDHVHPHARHAFRGALHHDRPERVEFTPYNGIPHLYVPVVTEPRERPARFRGAWPRWSAA